MYPVSLCLVLLQHHHQHQQQQHPAHPDGLKLPVHSNKPFTLKEGAGVVPPRATHSLPHLNACSLNCGGVVVTFFLLFPSFLQAGSKTSVQTRQNNSITSSANSCEVFVLSLFCVLLSQKKKLRKPEGIAGCCQFRGRALFQVRRSKKILFAAARPVTYLWRYF